MSSSASQGPMNSLTTCAMLSPNGLLFSVPSAEHTRPGLHGMHKASSVRPRNGFHVPMGQFLQVMESRSERTAPDRQMVGLKVPSCAHS